MEEEREGALHFRQYFSWFAIVDIAFCRRLTLRKANRSRSTSAKIRGYRTLVFMKLQKCDARFVLPAELRSIHTCVSRSRFSLTTSGPRSLCQAISVKWLRKYYKSVLKILHTGGSQMRTKRNSVKYYVIVILLYNVQCVIFRNIII